MVPLDHAEGALEDAIMDFCNEMHRDKIKEMPSIERWVEEFKLWLDPWTVQRRYLDTLEWLKQNNSVA